MAEPLIDLEAYLDEALARQQKENNREYVGMSGVGSCVRQQVLDGLHNITHDAQWAPEPFKPETLRLFNEGNVSERDLVERLEAGGLKVQRAQETVNYWKPSPVPVQGHVDLEVEVPTKDGRYWAVIEMKAIQYAAKKVAQHGSIAAAWPHYAAQLACYMRGRDRRYGCILIKDRASYTLEILQEWYELVGEYEADHVTDTPLRLVRYCDDGEGETVLYVSVLEQRLDHVADHVARREPGPREYDPANSKVWQCRYCQHRQQCLALGE